MLNYFSSYFMAHNTRSCKWKFTFQDMKIGVTDSTRCIHRPNFSSITCILIDNSHQIIVVVAIGFCCILKWDDKCGIHIMIKPLLYTLKYLQMDKAQAMRLCSIAASTTEFSSPCTRTDKVLKLGLGGYSVMQPVHNPRSRPASFDGPV